MAAPATRLRALILCAAGALCACATPDAAESRSGCWTVDYHRHGGFAGVNDQIKGSCAGEFELINRRTHRCRALPATDREFAAVSAAVESLLAEFPGPSSGPRKGPEPARCADCISQRLQVHRGDILVTCDFAAESAFAKRCGQLARALSEIHRRGQRGGGDDSGTEPATAGAACTADDQR